MVEFDNLNGSFSRISEGCDPDFLIQFPKHIAFIQEFFLRHGIRLDGTVEQLVAIEDFITAQRGTIELFHTKEFLQGLTAYCGELLRVALSGRWEMDVAKAFRKYPRDRYFPAIVDAEGQRHWLSATLESELFYLLNPNLNWDKMEGLYYRMLFALPIRGRLPVKPVKSWFFPPLHEEAE